MTQTSKKKRIPKKDLAAIKKEIKGLATKHPDTLSSKKAVFNMLPEIKDALDSGLVLPGFSSGLFRAMFAMKEIWNGKE
ncbi:hypothetical protein, partial [Pacificibacter sp. 1_MG-2023]